MHVLSVSHCILYLSGFGLDSYAYSLFPLSLCFYLFDPFHSAIGLISRSVWSVRATNNRRQTKKLTLFAKWRFAKWCRHLVVNRWKDVDV